MDIPPHVTPLLVYHLQQFVPGEAVALCLVDVEIHGNVREPNFATFPAMDRRALVLPQQLTRELLLEFALVLYILPSSPRSMPSSSTPKTARYFKFTMEIISSFEFHLTHTAKKTYGDGFA